MVLRAYHAQFDHLGLRTAVGVRRPKPHQRRHFNLEGYVDPENLPILSCDFAIETKDWHDESSVTLP